MLGEERESEEQSQQVREQDPFVAEVREPSRDAWPFRKRRCNDLEKGDEEKTADGDRERVAMEQRDADERQCEQYEIDGNTGDERRFDRLGHHRRRHEQNADQQKGREAADARHEISGETGATSVAAGGVFVPQIVLCSQRLANCGIEHH